MRDDKRYVELSARSGKVINTMAFAVNLMIVASTWGRWTEFAIALVGQGAVVVTNVFVIHPLVRRFGPRVDIARAVFNACVCAILYQYIGWPLAVWIWLPFCALTFNEFGGRHSLVVIIIMCGVQSIAGLVCGVPVVVPFVFVGLSVVCQIVGGQRTAIVRAMLADLDAEVGARQRIELELRQAQKLEAIGRLAAGVAHEINTPMQYIGDSLVFVQEGVAEVLSGPQDEADAAYLRAELPAAVTRASDGVARVAKIVKSLKQFAHPGVGGATSVDLNAAINDTLTIAAHEYKFVADVELRLGDLPLVTCDGGAVNQVLLNLIVNAAHAIADACAGLQRRGTITVTSRRDGDGVCIAITDTGTGIPEAVRPRLFEPFFTTKPVGKGMGHGLAGSRAIVEHHGGRIGFTTEVGVGTTFEVFLPEHGVARGAA